MSGLVRIFRITTTFAEKNVRGSFWKVGLMEFGLKGTSRVCRGRHEEVGIVEFGLMTVDKIVSNDRGKSSTAKKALHEMVFLA